MRGLVQGGQHVGGGLARVLARGRRRHYPPVRGAARARL
jgi:hypothetical protein